MITDYTVTDYYNDYAYETYYRKPKDWNEYYENMEEEEEE